MPIVIVFALIFSLQVRAEDLADQIFTAFGGRCHSYGNLTQQAQADQLSIASIYNTVKNDSNCKSIQSALTGLQNLNISQLLDQSRDSEDLESLTQTAADLELAIAQEKVRTQPDNDYITALKTELSSIKISIVKNKNSMKSDKKKKQKLQTIENFSSYSKQILSRISANDQCFVDKPNLAASLGAQIFALSSTLSGGIIGSIILTSGEIADNLIGFFRDKSINDKMRPIFEMKLGQAAGCGMEALASTYCKSQDLQTLLKLKQQKQNLEDSVQINSTARQGIELVTKDLRDFETWIASLDAGSLPTTAGRALDKKNILDLENGLKKATQDLSAVLAEEKKTVNKADDKEAALTKAAERLSNLMISNGPCFTNNCPTPSKISDIFALDPQCGPIIYLWSNGASYGRAKSEQSSTGSAGSICNTYIASKYPELPNINNFDKNISDLIMRAQKLTSDAASEVKESNPHLVLAQVEDKPKNFMINAVTYLDGLLDEKDGIVKNSNTKALIVSTQQKLKKALDVINQPSVLKTKKTANSVDFTQDVEVEAQRRISELANTLVNNDAFMISKAIGEIVRKDLLYKSENGKLDPGLNDLIEQSSSQSLTQLIEISLDLDKARSQISYSKEMTKQNLDSFYQKFEESLEKRVEKIKSDLTDDPERMSDLAELCLKTITAPKLGDKIKSLCRGVVLQSQDSKDIQLSFDEEMKKPFNDRVCSLNNYYRKNYLYRKNLSSIKHNKNRTKNTN